MTQRKCLFCGRSDTMEGKRADAKFCNPLCRKNWHRRESGTKPQFRMHNRIRTDMIEFLIALATDYQMNGPNALRLLAEKIGAPIREEEIQKELKYIHKIKDVNDE